MTPAVLYECREQHLTVRIISGLPPFFQKLFSGLPRAKYKILAIGCGVGVEVDVLCEAALRVPGVG